MARTANVRKRSPTCVAVSFWAAAAAWERVDRLAHLPLVRLHGLEDLEHRLPAAAGGVDGAEPGLPAADPLP